MEKQKKNKTAKWDSDSELNKKTPSIWKGWKQKISMARLIIAKQTRQVNSWCGCLPRNELKVDFRFGRTLNNVPYRTEQRKWIMTKRNSETKVNYTIVWRLVLNADRKSKPNQEMNIHNWCDVDVFNLLSAAVCNRNTPTYSQKKKNRKRIFSALEK